MNILKFVKLISMKLKCFNIEIYMWNIKTLSFYAYQVYGFENFNILIIPIMVMKYLDYCVWLIYLFIYLILFSSWQSLQNVTGHVKKEITMKVIIHEI
jgi:hypothetical protein